MPTKQGEPLQTEQGPAAARDGAGDQGCGGPVHGSPFRNSAITVPALAAILAAFNDGKPVSGSENAVLEPGQILGKMMGGSQ